MTLPASISTLDNLVQKVMQTWNVPGLALVVVKDDEIIHAKGYGVRQAGGTDPVDEHTLFAIGSNTKAFTAAAIGLLVQDNLLDWDDPVTRYLPGFRLQDANATALLTIRDLLCHRAGLGTWAGDLLLMSNYSAAEIVSRIRHIPPAYSFRAGYGYSNLMFITAGEVIAAVSGMSWDDFVQKRLFEPLGFQDSVTNPARFGSRTNIATPHEDLHGSLQPVAYGDDESIGACGAICASVSDIARWLRLQLNRGSLDGSQVIDPAILAETHTPHTPIRLSEIERKLLPSRHFAAYGLGWFLSDVHGRFVVRHTGGVDGMLSSTAMLPEERLGIAVFTNKLPNAAYMILPHTIVDWFTGAAEKDWVQAYLDIDADTKARALAATDEKTAARAAGASPSLPLEKFTGAYDSPIIGRATLTLQDDRLHISLAAHPRLKGTLEHWHYDTFTCTWEDPVMGESLMPFSSDGQGNLTAFRMRVREDWIDPLEHVFTRAG